MGHGPAVQELSRKIKAPVITTGKNFETFEYDFEALTGSTYRVGWKPANETVYRSRYSFICWIKLSFRRN